MVNCPHCHVPNSLDSHFCKGCGQSLPQEAMADAQRSHDELVSEGYKALHDSRTEEALLIAQSALEDSPESISALSLKGMALERQGQLAEALEVFEKVVVLNPGSALDKIKVQQLRNSISAQILTLRPAAPNRRLALTAAAAAVLLVSAVGVIAANFYQPARPGGNENLVAQNDPLRASPGIGQLPADPAGKGSTDAGSSGGTANPADQPAAEDARRDPNYVPPVREGAPRNGGSPNSGVPPFRFPNGDGRLPGAGDPSVGPVNPVVIGNNGGGSTTSGPPAGGQDDVDPTVGGNSGAANPPETGRGPGEINIQVSRRGPATNGGGGTDVDADMGSQALLAAARQQFLLGKYDQAARSYERLLAMGADAAMANQRLGQCYANLGRKPDAIAAYGRAIASLEARIRSSSGDTSALQRQLEACKQARKVLGG